MTVLANEWRRGADADEAKAVPLKMRSEVLDERRGASLLRSREWQKVRRVSTMTSRWVRAWIRGGDGVGFIGEEEGGEWREAGELHLEGESGRKVLTGNHLSCCSCLYM
jgi:hypothetical protein